jgi:hypothetical protein
MKIYILVFVSLAIVSCSKSEKDHSATATDDLSNTIIVDTTDISAISISIRNVDYGFTRVNQWGYGGFNESYKGLGPNIDTYNNAQWPSTFPHITMQAYFRKTHMNLDQGMYKYIDLANSTSIDSVVIDVSVTPSNTVDQPWALYSNVYTKVDRQTEWVSNAQGKVGFNTYTPCAFSNPGHSYDMDVKFENVVLSLVDSSGSLSGTGYPQTIIVKNAFFKTIKN